MRWLVRHRLAVLVGVATLVAIVVSAWLGRDNVTYSAALDPGNPDGNGAQALARVLGGQGVDVQVVRSAGALDAATTDAATTDAATTIVVTSSGNLGRSTTLRLLHDQGRAALVVVAPGPQLLTQMGVLDFPATVEPGAPVAAGCAAYDGLSVRVETADAYRAAGCFRSPAGVLLARPRAGLTLLGAPAILTNDQVLDGDNAAVALRLLGQRHRLVWYVPSLADLDGADSVSVRSLLPDWLGPGLWLLLAVALATIAWRGRRLGPLVREPLPVTVKAVETTDSLGRLYRRSGDRQHAARALREATRRRLAERLHLPRRVDPDRLVHEVAARSGRPPAEVDALIGARVHPPADDHALATLAQHLSELDREVSHR